MHVGCQIQVWTSTDRTSLVQEGNWNFQDCRELGSLHINQQKKQNKCQYFNQYHKSAIVSSNMFDYISHTT